MENSCTKINRGNFRTDWLSLKCILPLEWTINTFLDELKALSTPTNWVYWWDSCQAPSVMLTLCPHSLHTTRWEVFCGVHHQNSNEEYVPGLVASHLRSPLPSFRTTGRHLHSLILPNQTSERNRIWITCTSSYWPARLISDVYWHLSQGPRVTLGWTLITLSYYVVVNVQQCTKRDTEKVVTAPLN